MIPYCVNYFNYYFTRSLSTISKGFKIFTAGVQDLGLVTAVGSQASQVFSSLATTLHTSTTALGGFLAAAAGIAALIGIADLVTESFAEAEKKADQARESYESTKSELDGVNSELETTQSRINEIKAQGSLSPVDEAELAKLQTMNEQLLAHKAILEKVAGIEQKEVADAAAHVLTKKRTYDSGELTYAPTTVGGFVNIPSQPLYVKGDIIEETASKQKQLNSKTEEYNKLLKEQARLNPEDPEFKSIDNRLGVLEDQKKRLEVDIADNLKTIETNYADLFDEDGAILPGNEELVKRIDDLNYSLLGGVEKAQKTQEKINNIVSSSDGIKEQYDSLVDLAKARENVGIVAEDISDELSQSLKDAGVDVNDFIKQVNSEALSGNIEEMTRQLREAYTDGAATVMTKESMEAAKAYDDFISNLKPEEIEVFWNYVRDNDIDLTNIATEDLQNAFDTAMEQLEVDNVEPKIPLEDIISSEGFKNSVDDFQSNISTIQSALDSLKAGEDIDLVDLIQQFPQLAGETGNLQEALEGLKSESLSDILSTVIGQTSDLIDSGDIDRIGDFITQLLTSVDLSDVNLGDLKNEVISAMLPAADDAVGRQMIQDSVNSWFSNIKITDLSFEIDKTNVSSFLSGLSDIQSVLSSQKTGTSISLDTYNSDALEDYRSALEYVNGSMQLNIDKVNDLVHAKSQEELQTIAVNKANTKTQYIENARQVERLRSKLRDNNLALGETRDAINNEIASLLQENSALASNCAQYDIMAKSIENATSAYQHWINSQSASDYGDMADDAVSAITRINDTYKSGSDIFGDFGSKKFEAAVDFIVPDTVDREDLGAIQSYMTDFNQYLTKDSEGAITGLDYHKFLSNAVEQGLMNLDKTTGEYSIAFGKTMEDFENQLELSSGVVQAFADVLQLKGMRFDWADEINQDLDDLAVNAYESAEALRKIKGNENLRISMDVSEFEDKELAVQTLEDTIQEMNTLKAKPNVDTSSIEQANSVIQYCVAQKQALTAPAVMSVDTSQVQGELGTALDLLQQFTTARNKVEMQASIGADTSEAESEVNSLAEQIQSLTPEVKAKLNINDADVSSITTSIEQLTPEMMVKAGVDQSLVDEFIEADHETNGIVKWDNDKAAVDRYASQTKRASGVVTWTNNTNNVKKEFTAVGRVEWQNTTAPSTSKKKKASDVNGTAHVSGTAKASGNWGTPTGGKTLMGELGREIVVDPRTGKWYTVGDNGAEFVYLPKNAIVFNHVQSDEILKNGYVTGRGTALAQGNAMWTGGGVLYEDVINNNSSSGGNSGNNGYSGNSGEQAASNAQKVASAAKETAEATEDTKENIDFIEIKLSRLENIIERLKTVATSVYNSFSTRNRALAKEIKNVSDELDLQAKARAKYLEQANSVGLSKELQNKVINGSLDITEYDSETAELINKFKEFYEKARDCTTAINDLQVALSDLTREKFDNTMTQWEGKIAKTQRRIEHIENKMDLRTATSADNYTTREAIVASKKNIEDYQTLSKLYSKEYNQLAKERADLEKQMNEALKKGEKNGGMAEGSEDHNQMLDDLHQIDVEMSNMKKNTIDCFDSMAEECVNIFDNVVQKFDNKLMDLQHTAERAQSTIDRRNAFASDYVGYDVKRETSEQNISDYTDLIKNAQDQINVRTNEIAQLQARLQSFIDDGIISIGDKSYYNMVSQIQDIENEVDGLNASIIEFSNSISQEYSNMFNSISDEFNNKMSLAEHMANEYNTMIDTAEAKGYMSSKKYYEALREYQEGNVQMLQDEYNQLNDSLNQALASGEIEMGSAEWYRMNQEVNGVAEQISKANLEIIKLGNSIRDIEWEHFDYLQDTISKIVDESDFFIDLLDSKKMFNDNGSPTDAGKTVFGLHGVNYNTLMRQADDYASEVRKINSEIANDPANTDLIEHRDELLEKQRESIIAAEEEKEAIRDLVEEGIQIEIDNMRDLIDKYLEALNSQKDLFDYQKRIASQTKKITDIQKQISAYQGDTSEEGRLKIQQLQEELKQAQDDLEETQYDKYISDMTDLLNNLFDEYESMMNALLDDLDKLVANVIENINANADIIKSTLDSSSAAVGYTMTEEMNSIWQKAADSLAQDRAQRAESVSQLLEQMVEQGLLSREDANSIITTLGQGDANDAQRAIELINQLVANGSLAQEDANNIINRLGERTDAAKDVLSMYSADFASKSTTLNSTVDTIEKKVQSLVDAADKQAEATLQAARAQEEANRLQQEANAKIGENQGTKDDARDAVDGGQLDDFLEDLNSAIDNANNSLTGEKPKSTGSGGGKQESNKGTVKEQKPAAKSDTPKKNTGTQGDGKIQVGDQVTFVKGRYYYSSDGLSPTGYQKLGEKVYVGGINNASWAVKPYAIYEDKTLRNGLGWVSLDQLSGYASGKKRVGKKKYAWTQEGGTEFIMRPSDGAILTPIAQRDAVLDNDASGNIWKMANNPTDFIRENMKVGNIEVPNNNAAQNNFTQNLERVIFNFPDVKNYEEILHDLQYDNRFEKLISAMTIDRMAGKSSLAKYTAIRGNKRI